jgi:hypothetical protein
MEMWHAYLITELAVLFAALAVAFAVSVRIGAWRRVRR